MSWLTGLAAAIVPLCLLGVPAWGHWKGVSIYDAFIEGAQKGLRTALSVLPYLAAMLIAISVLRASGALEALLRPLGGALEALGLPAEVLPLAVLRPFSGSGALAMLSDIFTQTGVDSRASWIGACILGSSETFFYTLSLYCGQAGIRRTRFALPACLIAAVAGVLVAVWICP